MRTVLIGFALLLGSLFFLWNFVFYTVDQTEQAVVVQLGNPVDTVKEPGLYMRIPFLQNVIYFEKRVLALDAPSEEVTSMDQKRLVVDAFARYRIVDPLKFYQTVNNVNQAEQRLSAILNSNIRVTLAGRTFQAVLSGQRAELMRIIREQTNAEALTLGIEVVDVRIRRADLPQANSQAIFNRMRTDRQREAADIRAKGDQASQEIKSEADKQATIIVAEAQKTADIMRGEGDGERNRIFAEAFSKDPSFFEFYRSMQAYAAAMGSSDTTMVLSPDSAFFQYFKAGAGGGVPAAAPAPQ
ncbi:Modulator of FtsH protease HflC [Alphaproteobacteria bacterium SO-S41]|nr:Modulator of FtsH protease HflC [Alphaproteobacteria bacterium SO-S41]